MEQRWLSLSGIRDVLEMSKDQINALVRQGFIVKIGSGVTTRYLDPTPEYAEKLRTSEAFYNDSARLPLDIPLTALLTVRELAEIMGWDHKYTQQYVWRYKVQSVKVGRYNLISVATVRDLLWRRQGRKAHQRSPFLIQHLIAYFMQYHARESAEVPTDEEFAADDLIMRKLERMSRMRSPAKEQAYKDFYHKVDLAKQVVSALAPVNDVSVERGTSSPEAHHLSP